MPPVPQTHQFGTPAQPIAAKDKRFDLYYRGQLLCSNVHYAVCSGKRKQLLLTGHYSRKSFTIKPHA